MNDIREKFGEALERYEQSMKSPSRGTPDAEVTFLNELEKITANTVVSELNRVKSIKEPTVIVWKTVSCKNDHVTAQSMQNDSNFERMERVAEEHPYCYRCGGKTSLQETSDESYYESTPDAYYEIEDRIAEYEKVGL